MNVLGYLVTMANIQNLAAPGGPVRDVDVKVGNLNTLLFELRENPLFRVEDFKKSGYQRIGDKGMYISNNFRDYIFKGIGKPTDEGVLIKFDYNKASNVKPVKNDKPLTVLVNNGGIDKNAKKQLRSYLTKFNSNHQFRV